jgi:DNA-binding NarL/FixJ family response regulator
MGRMPKVLIVDDHVILRRGLRGILDTHPGWECCGEADSGEAAIDCTGELDPDIVIMDVSMPGLGGIKATQILHRKCPHVKILLLTLHKSTELLRAGLSAGASGYVLKSDGEEQLVAALEAVMRDEIYVTTGISPEVASRISQEVFPHGTAQETSKPTNAATSQD